MKTDSMQRKANQSGFTLLEITIVVAIIGVIASIAVPNMLHARENSNLQICRANRKTLERAEQLFVQRNNRHSDSIEELNAADIYTFARCPRGGTYFWAEFDESSDYYQAIVACSVHGIDTSSEENDEIFSKFLFNNGFNDPSEWEIVRGQWTMKDGVATSKWGRENRAFIGDEKWTDYVVSARGKIVKGKGLGIYFRSSKEKRVNGYIFQADPGLGNRFVFRKLKNGRESRPFASVKGPKGFDWNAYHDYEIKVEKDTFIAYVDGKEVLRSSDDSYSSGAVGIRAWRGSQAKFSDVNVRTNTE